MTHNGGDFIEHFQNFIIPANKICDFSAVVIVFVHCTAIIFASLYYALLKVNRFTRRFFFRSSVMAEGLPNGFQIQFDKPTTSGTGVHEAPDVSNTIFLPSVVTGTSPQLQQRRRSEPLMALPFDERQLYLTKNVERPSSMSTFARKCISVCVPVRQRKFSKFILSFTIYLLGNIA